MSKTWRNDEEQTEREWKRARRMDVANREGKCSYCRPHRGENDGHYKWPKKKRKPREEIRSQIKS